MTKTNVQSTPSNSKHHDTPNNKTHIIKFRVTAEEKASLELTCKLLNLSLSTFIRRAMDTNRVEARFEDEITLAIDCIAIENEYGNAPAQRAELDWLLYNKPLEYAQLVLPTVSLLCTPCTP